MADFARVRRVRVDPSGLADGCVGRPLARSPRGRKGGARRRSLMVRRPAIGLALLILCATPALAFPVEVTGDAVRVRVAPGGAVLGTVGRGERFEADLQRQDWLRVDWRGRPAWIAAA